MGVLTSTTSGTTQGAVAAGRLSRGSDR